MDDPTLRLLVVLDESELGLRTVSVAAALASRTGAALVLHVAALLEPVDARSATTAMDVMQQRQERCRQRAAEWFARAHALIQPQGIATHTELTIGEEPCAAVLRVAADHGCQLIVAGSQGRGTLARVVGGSLVAELLRESPVPVLVCRDDMPGGALAPAVGAGDA
jgi:nucleotide-binding universal stress UspA family protein